MGNMSYCRFQNTSKDLEDCLSHLQDDLEGKEAEARIRLVNTAKQIVKEAEDRSDWYRRGMSPLEKVCPDCGESIIKRRYEVCEACYDE